MVALKLNPARSFLAALATLLLLGSLFFGCSPEQRKRPYGLQRLGSVIELKRPQSFISSQAILVRYDEKGFSAMSLLCSYDLSPLKVVERDGRQILVSPHSESTYNLDGTILSGPTKNPLPYYQVVLAPGKYDSPPDTLFAKIGTEKPPEWRLQVP